MPSDCEIAWAAGLFEGEGSIYYTAMNDSWILGLAMCDRDVVERFQAVFPESFGMVHRYAKSNPMHADAWRTKAVGLKAEAPLRAMIGHFGERRREKALKALDAIAGKHPSLQCVECSSEFRKKRWGHRFCSSKCRSRNTARRLYRGHYTKVGRERYRKGVV